MDLEALGCSLLPVVSVEVGGLADLTVQSSEVEQDAGLLKCGSFLG